MTINEHLLKISAGSITLLSPLELGSEVSLLVKATVTKVEDHDNQDGSFNRVYVVKGGLAESIQ